MNRRNLMPPRRIAAAVRRRGVRRWTAINGGYLIILTIAGVVQAVASVGAQPAPPQAGPPVDLGRLNTSLAGLRRQAGALKIERQSMADLSRRPDWSILLDRLGQTLGDGVVLNEVTTQIGNSQTGGVQAGGGPPGIRISGMGRSTAEVTAFAMRVEQLQFFGRVRLSQTADQSVQGKSATGFTLLCTMPQPGGGTAQ